MFKKLLLILLFIGCMGAIVGWYLYNKKPTDIKNENADVVLSATALVAEFNTDEAAANAKLLDKIITVTGALSDVHIDGSGATVFLATDDSSTSVTCSFYETELEKVKKLQPGALVKIKGVCTGKLFDVVLNKCSIVE